MTTTSIRSLRQSLLDAKRHGGSRRLAEIACGLRDLADSRYRCCLVDFESCRPAFYGRMLDFGGSRVKVELEFPIEPRLRTVQWLPLSHLADYDEVENGESIREIYRDVSPYLKTRTTNLERRKESAEREPAGPGANGNRRHSLSDLSASDAPGRNGKRRGAMSTVLWGAGVAGLLTMMLTLFATI